MFSFPSCKTGYHGLRDRPVTHLRSSNHHYTGECVATCRGAENNVFLVIFSTGMSSEQLEKMQQEQMALQQEIMELEKAEPLKNVRFLDLRCCGIVCEHCLSLQ